MDWRTAGQDAIRQTGAGTRPGGEPSKMALFDLSSCGWKA
jgi:hypothetical protein